MPTKPHGTRSRKSKPKTRAVSQSGISSSAYGIGNRIFQLADIDIELGEAFDVGGIPALRRAQQRTALDFARARVIVLRDGVPLSTEEARRLPGYRLLTGATGMSGLSSFQYRRWECLNAQRTGHSEALIIRNDYGDPMGIRPIKPGLLDYRIVNGEIAYFLDNERVDEYALLIQQWDCNEANAWFGLSPLEQCREALRAEAHRQSVWRAIVDSGFVGKIKVTKQGTPFQPEIAEELQDKYGERHDYKHVHSRPVIGQENADFAPLVEKAYEAGSASRSVGVKDVAMVADFPAGMLGDADGRTYEDQREAYADDIDGRLAAFADQYASKLLPPGHELLMLASHLHVTTAKSGYRGLAMLYQLGAISRAELHQRMGGMVPLTSADDQSREVKISGVTPTNSAEGDGENGGAS